jgi:peptidoglycan/LPS O-acetylase OafA/YrhL
LAVEEHFYLILPSLLVFTPKRWRVPALLALAVAIGVRRITPNSWFSFHTDVRLDALLVPAAFAVALRSPFLTIPANRARLVRILRFWPFVALILFIPVTYNLIPRTTGLLIAWFTPLLILGTMLNPKDWFSRLLETSILRYIGRLSFSLYLWQQLFLLSHYGAGTGRLGPLQAWPLKWIMLFACAIFSYYLVEQPFIKLGHQLAPNVAANRVRRAPKAIEE